MTYRELVNDMILGRATFSIGRRSIFLLTKNGQVCLIFSLQLAVSVTEITSVHSYIREGAFI